MFTPGRGHAPAAAPGRRTPPGDRTARVRAATWSPQHPSGRRNATTRSYFPLSITIKPGRFGDALENTPRADAPGLPRRVPPRPPGGAAVPGMAGGPQGAAGPGPAAGPRGRRRSPGGAGCARGALARPAPLSPS